MNANSQIEQDPPNLGAQPPRLRLLGDADAPPRPSASGRSAWRQRLIDVERGAASGVRSSSAFFVYLFGISVILAGGVILGLGVASWTAVILATTIVVVVELFQHAFRSALEELAGDASDSTRRVMERAVRTGTAAVFAATAGAVFTVVVVFASRLTEVFSGTN